jgi:arylsulfatase A-like enzyme
MIHIVDRNVGRVLDVLERRGWLEDSLILFTADHGEMLGEGGKGGKCWWEDPSVRVPLLVRCPAWMGPKVVDETLASCHDVTATILDYAAGSDVARERLPGCSSVSLKPYLTGAAPHVRQVVYSENGGQFGRPWRMVDDGRYRYVWLLDRDEELLFDVESDPNCLHNLASEGAQRAAIQRLRQEMLRIHVEHPTPKAGKAAYSPLVDHRITRERLEASGG